MDTDSISYMEKWYLPSGNLALDYILSGRVDGLGGYPSGIVEVHGDPATGKSLLFAKAIGNAQKAGLTTILADAEGRWDYDFSAMHGTDSELLRKHTFYPETVEEFAVKSMEILQKVGKIVMVLDSVAILSTVQEKDDVEEGSIKADQGRKAQKIKAAMRVLSSEIRKTGSLVLISNHLIAQPGAYTGRITPGGQGVPFQANVRLELTKPTQIKLKGKEHPIGVQMHIECTKNSVIAPFGSCDLDMYFASGVSPYSGIVNLAKDLGILELKGAYYYYGEGPGFYDRDIERICTTTDLLKDNKWSNPYWK
jgi:recombination protein RecA